MAYCPKCNHFVSLKEIFLKPMECPKCKLKLGFEKKQYRQVTRPGIFIALLLFFNVYYTMDPVKRMLLNVILLVLWLLFFVRFIQYLRSVIMIERR